MGLRPPLYPSPPSSRAPHFQAVGAALVILVDVIDWQGLWKNKKIMLSPKLKLQCVDVYIRMLFQMNLGVSLDRDTLSGDVLEARAPNWSSREGAPCPIRT